MAAEKKPHKAKPSHKNRKHGRNAVKCARYRATVGKPRRVGNKRGKGRSGGPSVAL
jgi:hypothetical protein